MKAEAPKSLSFQLTAVYCSLTFVLALILTLVFGLKLSTYLQLISGEELSKLAYEMQSRIDANLYERFRDIEVAASSQPFVDENTPNPLKQKILDTIQSSYPNYTWIGIADLDGKVLTSTKSILQGVDVSKRPWFIEAKKASFIGDIHEAVLLNKYLAPLTIKEKMLYGSPRFLDVAAPIKDANGKIISVIGAHISWKWATELQQEIMKYALDQKITLIVLDKNHKIILGPEHLRETQYDYPELKNILESKPASNEKLKPGFLRLKITDGAEYLIGYSRCQGFLDSMDLGWTVITQQELKQAQLPIVQLLIYFAKIGLGVSFLFILASYIFAKKLAKPLKSIALQADKIRLGNEDLNMPIFEQYFEIEVISNSLNALISQLSTQKKELIGLNKELESRVIARTENLNATNYNLKLEIEKRRKIEDELHNSIKKLNKMVDTDYLTDLLNRRAFYQRAEKLIIERKSFGIMMLDIDHFKVINDNYGHSQGDLVIKTIAQVCQDACGNHDLIARFGGEEFAILCLTQSLEETLSLAKAILQKVEKLEFVNENNPFKCTLSIGVYFKQESSDSIDAMLKNADAALYQSKAEGRNQLTLFGQKI